MTPEQMSSVVAFLKDRHREVVTLLNTTDFSDGGADLPVAVVEALAGMSGALEILERLLKQPAKGD